MAPDDMREKWIQMKKMIGKFINTTKGYFRKILKFYSLNNITFLKTSPTFPTEY